MQAMRGLLLQRNTSSNAGKVPRRDFPTLRRI